MNAARETRRESWIEREVSWHLLHGRTKKEMLHRIRQFPASHRLIGHALIKAASLWDIAEGPKA